MLPWRLAVVPTSVPAEIVVPPEYVLAPVSVRVSEPCLRHGARAGDDVGDRDRVAAVEDHRRVVGDAAAAERAGRAAAADLERAGGDDRVALVGVRPGEHERARRVEREAAGAGEVARDRGHHGIIQRERACAYPIERVQCVAICRARPGRDGAAGCLSCPEVADHHDPRATGTTMHAATEATAAGLAAATAAARVGRPVRTTLCGRRSNPRRLHRRRRGRRHRPARPLRGRISRTTAAAGIPLRSSP